MLKNQKLTDKELEELKSYPISFRLQQLRIINGLKQKEFAEYVGITQTNVSLWEKGKVVPSVVKLRKVIELYNLPLNYFADVTIDKIKFVKEQKNIEINDEDTRHEPRFK